MWKIKIVLASENLQLVCLFICLLVDDPCSKIPISVLSHFLSLQFIVTWSSTNFYDCQKTLSEEEKRGKNKNFPQDFVALITIIGLRPDRERLLIRSQGKKTERRLLNQKTQKVAKIQRKNFLCDYSTFFF